MSINPQEIAESAKKKYGKSLQSKQFMRRINNPILAAIVLAGFIALSNYALEASRNAKDGEYGVVEVKKLNALVGRSNAILAPSKRQSIMSIYHLSESDVDKAADIFR